MTTSIVSIEFGLPVIATHGRRQRVRERRHSLQTSIGLPERLAGNPRSLVKVVLISITEAVRRCKMNN